MIDGILDESNPFKNIGTEDIWIEHDLFDDDNSQAVKDVSKDIIDRADDAIHNFPTVTDDNETIDDTIKTIIIYDGIQIPEEDGIVVDTGVSKKVKIISSHANRIKTVADKILNKYKKQKQIGKLKAKNKKAADWLTQAGWLNTDDQQTIDYNNDANITDFDDLETIDYNKDTSLGDLINLKKN